MRHSPVARLARAIGATLAMLALGSAPNHAQRTGGPPASATLITPWGEPDLQGIWSGDTLTPLQRPVRFANKPVLTPAEEAAILAEINSRPGRDGRAEPGSEADVAGAY